eukprot:3271948-Rhodomonas_salina.1
MRGGSAAVFGSRMPASARMLCPSSAAMKHQLYRRFYGMPASIKGSHAAINSSNAAINGGSESTDLGGGSVAVCALLVCLRLVHPHVHTYPTSVPDTP